MSTRDEILAAIEGMAAFHQRAQDHWLNDVNQAIEAASAQNKAEEMARILQRVDDQLRDQLNAEVRAAEMLGYSRLVAEDIPLPPDYQAEQAWRLEDVVELQAEARTDRKAAEELQARWRIVMFIMVFLTLAAAVAALFFG